jgi:TRAP-type uncharacterized transport system fused permease subunit
MIYCRGKPLTAIKQYIKKMHAGVLDGARSTTGMMMLLACMGIVVRLLVGTGISQKIAFAMVDLAGGYLPLLLFLMLIAATLLGMAVSTIVTYVLVVLLAVPALAHFGVEPIVAHFTVFYLAVVSGITPPVALVAAVAAQISRASFFSVAVSAVRIGLPMFLLPFIFVFSPALLIWESTTPVVIMVTATGLLGITYGLNSMSTSGPALLVRLLFFGLGLLSIFYPSDLIREACAGSLAVITILYIIFFKVMKRKLL